jgi:aspartyl-tRNA(Asn)/glutamyl-tRNA(Gln) amidotransferase subunit A
MSLAWSTLTELRAMLARGDTSSLEIVAALLDRIGRADPTLHAFIDVYDDAARALARAADQARAAGLPTGPLHGLPIVLKDLLDIEGRIGTMGSRHYASRVATQTSATVERLLAAGMVPLGKVHLTEFAFGGWGTNPLMGTPRNPWDLGTHRVPGGSSSGTGVAVAAGFAPVGIGSDTGGSVRIPSAFNGLTGLKVTYGRISLHATGLLSWTLDTIGPMARCVRDCALLLDALAAPDPRDPATLAQPLERFDAEPRAVRGLRMALPDASQLPASTEPGVRDAWASAARDFEALGVQVIPVRLPAWFWEARLPVTRIIASECFALHRDYVDDRAVPLGDAVRHRILGARDYGPSEYAQVLRTMAQHRAEFARWFEDYDAILLPTVGIVAAPLDLADEASPVISELTRPGNYLGLCALSQPCGLVGGLPVGLQIIGRPFGERTVLALGQAFESAKGFNRARPARRAADAARAVACAAPRRLRDDRPGRLQRQRPDRGGLGAVVIAGTLGVAAPRARGRQSTASTR